MQSTFKEVVNIGFLDIFKRHDELEQMYDIDLIENTSSRVQLKRLAIQICINMIARTVSQSEFRVKKNKDIIKGDLYYKLNVKPNLNQTAPQFWQTVIYKLIYDNECLIIKTDSDDFLIADDFYKMEYAVFEDGFKNVIVKNHEFNRSYKRGEVIYLEYNNGKLKPLIDSLYDDYGELFGRALEFQKYKNQIRATVDVEGIRAKDKEDNPLQNFINKIYKSFNNKTFAVVPQQKGVDGYTEHSSGGNGPAVDEIEKVTDGFLSKIAMALGIPFSMLKGDMADVEKQTRNYMTFCIDPLLKKITGELDMQLFEKKEYLEGYRMDVRRVSYSNMFDVATAADKLRSAGIMNGNELRDELGLDRVDDEMLNSYYITKNYVDDGGTSEEEQKEGKKE